MASCTARFSEQQQGQIKRKYCVEFKESVGFSVNNFLLILIITLIEQAFLAPETFEKMPFDIFEGNDLDAWSSHFR